MAPGGMPGLGHKRNGLHCTVPALLPAIRANNIFLKIRIYVKLKILVRDRRPLLSAGKVHWMLGGDYAREESNSRIVHIHRPGSRKSKGMDTAP
jgi:hypothetical protein